MDPITVLALTVLFFRFLGFLIMLPDRLRAQEYERFNFEAQRNEFLKKNVFFGYLPDGEDPKTFTRLIYSSWAQCSQCCRPWAKAREVLLCHAYRFEQGHLPELARAQTTEFIVWVRTDNVSQYFRYYWLILPGDLIFTRFRFWSFESELACCKKARIYFGLQEEKIE